VCVCVFCVCNFSDRNVHIGVNRVLREINFFKIINENEKKKNLKYATVQIARCVS